MQVPDNPAAKAGKTAPPAEKRKGSSATGKPGSGPGRGKQKGCSGHGKAER